MLGAASESLEGTNTWLQQKLDNTMTSTTATLKSQLTSLNRTLQGMGICLRKKHVEMASAASDKRNNCGEAAYQANCQVRMQRLSSLLKTSPIMVTRSVHCSRLWMGWRQQVEASDRLMELMTQDDQLLMEFSPLKLTLASKVSIVESYQLRIKEKGQGWRCIHSRWPLMRFRLRWRS